MQEEKERTTPPQEDGAKRRRRRKKNHSRPQGEPVQAVQDKEPEAVPDSIQEPETPETPQPPEEAAVPDAEADSASTEESVVTESGSVSDPEPEQAEPAEETQPTPEVPDEPEPADAPEPEEKAEPVETTPETADTVPQQAETPAPAAESAETPAEEPSEEAAEPQSPETAPAADAAAEDVPAKETDAEPAELTASNEEEPPEEDEKRLSDMTRTVQLSVEQIMAQVREDAPSEEASQGEETAEEPDSDTLSDQLRSGLSGMAKWLLLVVFVVLVIAGFGVAWLYRSATPDMLPQITVTFAGQTVEPTAYKWKVPVVGNLFKRTYADTLSGTPVTLEEPVEQVSPDFVVSPSDYRTELTITDSNEEVLFEGDTDSFSSFQFTANGDYTAKLVVHSDASAVPGDTSVTGTETWQFGFTVGVRPSVRLSSTTVNQGSVVAVRVGDTLDGQPPVIATELENAGFFAASTGWVCYLPIPWNQPAGTQTIEVSAGGYTETLELKIQAAEWGYKDYYSNSQRVSPYIGEKDLPAELQKLLASSESAIAWSDGSFVQPFLNTIDVKLAYGTTEYVGRSYSERSTNNGAGGRTWTNMVLSTSAGELLIAPASGKVLLAKDLGGDFGYTLVIDHGAGVKSIFYNLQGISVKAGASVKQGQVLATCGRTTVAEMRIGTVPIDPLQVWRGQCDALKNY